MVTESNRSTETIFEYLRILTDTFKKEVKGVQLCMRCKKSCLVGLIICIIYFYQIGYHEICRLLGIVAFSMASQNHVS